MNFFRKIFRRHMITISRNGWLYQLAIRARGDEEPYTLCETLQASAEGIAITGKDACKNRLSRIKIPKWIEKLVKLKWENMPRWAKIAYCLLCFIFLSFLIYAAVAIEDGWECLAFLGIMIVLGVAAAVLLFILLLIAVISYAIVRLAAERLCPIDVDFIDK